MSQLSDELAQLALEIAAACVNQGVHVGYQIGRLRTISAWYWGSKGVDLQTVEEATEVMVARTLDEIDALLAMQGAQ